MKFPTDLTGFRFGRLEVISEAEPTTNEKGHKLRQYRCRCDCGNEVIKLRSALIGFSTLSCGCYRKEVSAISCYDRTADLTGQKIGKLTVLHEYRRRSGGTVHWVCRCECGIEVAYPARALVAGAVTDCGVCGAETEVELED